MSKGFGALRGLYYIVSASAALSAGGASAAELRYDLDGLGGEPRAAQCERCFEGLLAPATPPAGVPLTGTAATPTAFAPPIAEDSPLRPTVSPTALTDPADKSGWVDVRVEADPAEPVSFVVGMNVADRNDVRMDNLARNDAVRFPSTRVVAGLRFDLGREQ